MFSYIREHHMLKANDRVVAGISGGADSLCLLFVLLEWRKTAPLEIAVAHVNHGIRQEAAQDARFVEEICRQYALPFFLTEVSVTDWAREKGISEEEAGRQVRYEAFERAAKDFQATKIAVAHNSNDCSETMLFHLFRGSGLKGLCGIPPVRDNIIRPVLCLERGEIEAYLQEKKLSWCMDTTNVGDDYTRNRIRHHILPYAETRIVSGCVSHMMGTAKMLTEVEDYLEEQTKEAARRCVGAAGEINIPAFSAEHPALQKRILLLLVKSLTPTEKDISRVHIEALLTLFERAGNRTLDLPFGIKAGREYEKFFLRREPDAERKSVAEPSPDIRTGKEISLVSLSALPIEIPLSQGEFLEFSLLEREIGEGFMPETVKKDENACTKWFDCDKIKKSLVVRSRKTGDYLTIADGRGGQKHKSLKDYMINAKIPAERRDSIPLLADENHILWLIGWRISEHYKITGNTKRILQVQLRRGCENSKTEENYGGES